MPYNPTTGIITAPVSIQDLVQCLKVMLKKRSGVGSWIYKLSTDLGLITNVNPQILSDGWVVDSREDINIWSKYKPVDNTEIQYMDQWDAAHNTWKNDATWFHGRGYLSNGWRYGLQPTKLVSNSYSELKTFLKNAYNTSGGMNGWTVHLPAGGSDSPYRLTDYAGYNHHAAGLADSFSVVSPIVLNPSTNIGTVTAMFMHSPDDGTNVTPENLLTPPSGKYIYFGVLLTYTKNSDEHIYIGTATHPDEFTIQGDIQLEEGITMTAYPFISILSQPVSFDGVHVGMEIYPIPLLRPCQVRTSSSSAAIDLTITGWYFSLDYTVAKIKITKYQINYTNCWIELTSGANTYYLSLGTWSGRTVTGTLSSSGSSTRFDLSAMGTNDYTITITNLNPNLRYTGKLYIGSLSGNPYKNFGIMEEIDPNI